MIIVHAFMLLIGAVLALMFSSLISDKNYDIVAFYIMIGPLFCSVLFEQFYVQPKALAEKNKSEELKRKIKAANLYIRKTPYVSSKQ